MNIDDIEIATDNLIMAFAGGEKLPLAVYDATCILICEVHGEIAAKRFMKNLDSGPGPTRGLRKPTITMDARKFLRYICQG